MARRKQKRREASCLVNYYVEGKSKERHHLASEELGQLERAYATRGNVFSYILPWESILRNAAAVTTDAVFESWPHPPHVVAHMVRFLFYGTTEEHCMKHLKELILLYPSSFWGSIKI